MYRDRDYYEEGDKAVDIDAIKIAAMRTAASAMETSPSRLPLSHQEKTIAALHEAIGELEKHLEPVLTPEMPEDTAAKDGEARQRMSPLAEQMLANNWAIDRAISRLNDLIRRVEC
jgi:hypothetical protein